MINHVERGVVPLHDAAGVNCNKGVTTDIITQGSSICAKVRMLDDNASVI